METDYNNLHSLIDIDGSAASGDDDLSAPGFLKFDSEINPTELSRISYKHRNSKASIFAHKIKNHLKQEKHNAHGIYLKSGIFGGLDGIVSTFSTISSLIAAGTLLSASVFFRHTFILGISNLIADASAMGIGDYVSKTEESRFLKREYERECWEYDNYLEGEVQELIDIYVSKNMEYEDAKRVSEILSKKKKHFIDIMMAEELGIPPGDFKSNNFAMGVVTFTSFLIFGIIPLVPQLFGVFIVYSVYVSFAVSVVVTLLTLFILGTLSSFWTDESWVKSGMILLFTGGITSFMAFICSFLLEKFLHK